MYLYYRDLEIVTGKILNINMNRSPRSNLKLQTNKVKKVVSFRTGQQWRLNRNNTGLPNKNVINQNLAQIKQGLTPLKKAQKAYYGSNQSPLFKSSPTNNSNSKLPVHARLGQKNPIPNPRINPKTPTLTQLMQQKRLLRKKSIEQDQTLRKLEQTSYRNQKIIRNRQQRPVNIKNKFRNNMNGVQSSPADLTVSVANEFAVKQIHRTPKNSLHCQEVDPVIQQEIALIQQRSRQALSSNLMFQPIPGLNINPSTAIQNLATTNIPTVTSMNLGSMITPNTSTMISMNPTTTIVSQPNRIKLSLHERFSKL